MIEIMIVVVIIGILSAVAIPAYGAYVMRTRVTEAFTGLGSVQNTAEEYWNNNRTYGSTTAAFSLPATTTYFAYSFAANTPTQSAYTVVATGKGAMQGFIYSIDQNGNRVTVNTPSWGRSDTCWVNRSGTQCVQ